MPNVWVRPPRAFGCLAAFVFPVFCAKKGNINSPDRGDLACFQSLRLIDRVAPHDVPAGMIVVRL